MNEDVALAASYTSDSEIEDLIAANKLLRILHPAIKAQAERALSQGKPMPFVLQHKGHFYISLIQVEDDKKRKHFYSLIQQRQAGEQVSVEELPPAIQQVLEPELTLMGRLFGALLLGAVAGIATGVLAMALATLVVNGITWLGQRSVGQFAGMEVTAVSFIIFTLVGWAAAGLLTWRKPHLWVGWGTNTDILRRK